MDLLQQEALAAFICEGDHFSVTTEKMIDLLPGAPVSRVIKRSSYSIIVRGALARELGKWGATAEVPRWSVPSKKYDGVVEHKARGELYVLSALDKKSGQMGSSEFYVEKEVPITSEDGDVAQYEVKRGLLDQAAAAQVKKFLPPKGSFGGSFPLPLRSIVEIDAPVEAEAAQPKEKDLPWD